MYCRFKPKRLKDAKVVKKEVKKDVVEKIVSAWKVLVESPTEESYASGLLKFKEVCMPFPQFIVYVETTVLNLTEKFVRAWRNKILLLGCRSTNIVESAHGVSLPYSPPLSSCFVERRLFVTTALHGVDEQQNW